MSTLKSNTNTQNSDTQGLAGVMANIVLSNATDTLSYIRAQINKASDPRMERALAYCAELYIPVVKYNLPRAIDAFEYRAVRVRERWDIGCGEVADACKKNFLGSIKFQPLSEGNKLLHSLSDVAVAIVKLLLTGLIK